MIFTMQIPKNPGCIQVDNKRTRGKRPSIKGCNFMKCYCFTPATGPDPKAIESGFHQSSLCKRTFPFWARCALYC